MKLGPARLADGTIVKRMNVYDVLAGDRRFVAFASNEISAARAVIGHMRAEVLPEPFDVTFLRPTKDLVLDGTYADLLSFHAHVEELRATAADFTARAVIAESYVEDYRAKLAAALKVVAEAREMLYMIKGIAGPAFDALNEALDHCDAVPLPDDLRRK